MKTNKIAQFKQWILSIVPHRLTLKQGDKVIVNRKNNFARMLEDGRTTKKPISVETISASIVEMNKEYDKLQEQVHDMMGENGTFKGE